jgi:hypothetical protein
MSLDHYILRRAKDSAFTVDVTDINTGNVITYSDTGLDPDTDYWYKLKAVDSFGNESAFTTAIQVTTNPTAFDRLSTAHLGVWATKRHVSAYAGACVRVKRASDSVEQDIGFAVDGWLDFAAYSAFGTGNENVVKRYDQSGNGFDLDIDSANNIKIVLGSENGKPCLKGNANMGVNAGFTDWNGLADLNMYSGIKPTSLTTHLPFCGGSSGRAAYIQAGATVFWWVNSAFAEYNTFAYLLTYPFQHLRWQFDGGGATDLLQGRFYVDATEVPGSSGAAISGTLNNETGLYINSANNLGSAGDNELYYNFYIGYELTAPEAAAIDAQIAADYAVTNVSHLHGAGDSLTIGYNVNITDPGHQWTTKLAAKLATDRGEIWENHGYWAEPLGYETSEVGATTSRVLQLMNNSLDARRDPYKAHDIVTVWGGSNDLGAASGTGYSYQEALTGTLACVNNAYDFGFVCPGNGLVPTFNLLPRMDLGTLTFSFNPTDVTTGTGNVNKTSHGLYTGQSIYFGHNSHTSPPLGLSRGVRYYVIAVDANNFKLATSYANALAGTAVTGGTQGGGTHVVQAATPMTFVSADVNTGTGNINKTSHGLTSGQSIYWTTTGTLPFAMAANTRYFVIVVDANNFKLATSYAASQVPTPITGGTTGSGTFVLARADNVTFEWDRTDYNAGLAGTITGKGFLVDLTAIVALQDATNETYYLDWVHLNEAGQDLIRDAVATAIEPYL